MAWTLVDQAGMPVGTLAGTPAKTPPLQHKGAEKQHTRPAQAEGRRITRAQLRTHVSRVMRNTNTQHDVPVRGPHPRLTVPDTIRDMEHGTRCATRNTTSRSSWWPGARLRASEREMDHEGRAPWGKSNGRS